MNVILESVSKSYQSGEGTTLTILKSVTCCFPAGRSVAVCGPSGIGKSTLLYLLAGLDGIDSGSIRYDSTDLHEMDEDSLAVFRRDHIGVIFQSHNLLPEFTAIENVALALILREITEEEAFDRAESLLVRVGLGHRLSHRPSMLSGGENQRVALARALVGDPPVVLADEPTGNLDPSSSQEIGELLLELHQEQKQGTLIVVTHSETLANSLEFVFEMESGGRLIERGGSV